MSHLYFKYSIYEVFIMKEIMDVVHVFYVFSKMISHWLCVRNAAEKKNNKEILTLLQLAMEWIICIWNDQNRVQNSVHWEMNATKRAHFPRTIATKKKKNLRAHNYSTRTCVPTILMYNIFFVLLIFFLLSFCLFWPFFNVHRNFQSNMNQNEFVLTLFQMK